ncbi:MAG: S-layer homology domain-containing protein [Clostridia bacterium]|nr:S-layer homology domain-containing protein [Clostridia bacterium]
MPELEAWLANYGEEISADDVQTTDRDEAKLYEYVLDASKESVYVRRISGKDIILTIDDIADVLYEEALLTILEVRHYTESQKVFETFPTLFALNLTNFRKLSESKQGDVYSDMKGNYESCVLAGTKFNSLVDTLLDASKRSPGGNSGGSRNDSDGYTGPALVASGSTTSQETAVTGMPFPDMASAAWANEAVAALKAKGIISGDNNGKFNPNDYVTRAEFAKMMVIVTGAEIADTNVAFVDVGKDDWYYPYVKAAAQKGLVKGDSAGNFNPNERITREDMAVILYRAYSIGENLGYTVEFADSGNISEYAKEAIAFLSAKKIINGVGNNLFAPKNTATRAEAAQLLYNALAQIGK